MAAAVKGMAVQAMAVAEAGMAVAAMEVAVVTAVVAVTGMVVTAGVAVTGMVVTAAVAVKGMAAVVVVKMMVAVVTQEERLPKLHIRHNPIRILSWLQIYEYDKIWSYVEIS